MSTTHNYENIITNSINKNNNSNNNKNKTMTGQQQFQP